MSGEGRDEARAGLREAIAEALRGGGVKAVVEAGLQAAGPVVERLSPRQLRLLFARGVFRAARQAGASVVRSGGGLAGARRAQTGALVRRQAGLQRFAAARSSRDVRIARRFGVAR